METGLPRDGWGYANHFNSVKQPLAQNGNKLTALSLPAPRRVAEHRQKRPSPHRPHHFWGLRVATLPVQPPQPTLPSHAHKAWPPKALAPGRKSTAMSAPGSCQHRDAASLQIKHIATGCFYGNEHLQYSRHRDSGTTPLTREATVPPARLAPGRTPGAEFNHQEASKPTYRSSPWGWSQGDDPCWYPSVSRHEHAREGHGIPPGDVTRPAAPNPWFAAGPGTASPVSSHP